MAKSIKVWNGSSWEDVAVAMPDTSTFVTTSTVTELAQDAIGNNLSDLFTYNDSTGGITLNNAKISDFLLDGASGNSYGLIGTSAYLDVKNTNGYNKEIELDIAAVAAQLVIDGFAKLASPTFTGTVTLPGDPSSSLHAATKQYVDNTASGIVAKPQVLGATTANIDATYSNGTAGVGATLTHNTNGVFPAEAGGATGWAVGKGILVKNQTNKAQNGRYYVSDMGSVSTPYVLTRCTYCDEASEIPGAYIFVQAGTSAGTGWVQSVADASTFTVGTDDINVYQFSGSGTITAGTGITVNGNQVSIDTAVTQARVANVTDTEIGYLNGVTSSIQNQIDNIELTPGPPGPATVPQNEQSSAYTVASSDNGKFIDITTGGVTVATSTAMTAGQNFVIYNDSTSNQTITQGSSVTLRQAGTANTGDRTLAQYGVATVLCVGSNTYVIAGTGLS